MKWQKVDNQAWLIERNNPHHNKIPIGQQQQMHMNWSHFKPEFSGKPEEDVEVHLLQTNDWMTTHDFPEAVKV